MRFVKKFTPPDFQAKNFTPLISPNFNSFGDNSENGEIYTAGQNFTLPPAVAAVTNLTSGIELLCFLDALASLDFKLSLSELVSH